MKKIKISGIIYFFPRGKGDNMDLQFEKIIEIKSKKEDAKFLAINYFKRARFEQLYSSFFANEIELVIHNAVFMSD